MVQTGQKKAQYTSSGQDMPSFRDRGSRYWDVAVQREKMPLKQVDAGTSRDNSVGPNVSGMTCPVFRYCIAQKTSWSDVRAIALVSHDLRITYSDRCVCMISGISGT